MIYVFRHTITDKVTADNEAVARQRMSFYYEVCPPEEWELVDVRGETRTDGETRGGGLKL